MIFPLRIISKTLRKVFAKVISYLIIHDSVPCTEREKETEIVASWLLVIMGWDKEGNHRFAWYRSQFCGCLYYNFWSRFKNYSYGTKNLAEGICKWWTFFIGVLLKQTEVSVFPGQALPLWQFMKSFSLKSRSGINGALWIGPYLSNGWFHRGAGVVRLLREAVPTRFHQILPKGDCPSAECHVVWLLTLDLSFLTLEDSYKRNLPPAFTCSAYPCNGGSRKCKGERSMDALFWCLLPTAPSHSSD